VVHGLFSEVAREGGGVMAGVPGGASGVGVWGARLMRGVLGDVLCTSASKQE
jgi:hypothetical protein